MQWGYYYLCSDKTFYWNTDEPLRNVFINQCEMKQLDLENNEILGKVYLPAGSIIEISRSY